MLFKEAQSEARVGRTLSVAVPDPPEMPGSEPTLHDLVARSSPVGAEDTPKK